MPLSKGLTLAYFFLGSFGFTCNSYAGEVTSDWLKSVLDQKSVTSVEEILQILPADYRKSYTLMHSSNSLQEAEFQKPRIIFYGPDASLLMGVGNGDPNLMGHDTIEMIQFDRKTNAFRFSLASRDDDGRFRVKEAVGCTGCHHPDLRPNWAAYSHWPGAYGADDDRPGGELSDPKEVQQLVTFLKGADQHPRYRYLENLQKNYAPITGGRPGDSPKTRFSAAPNFRFSFRLSQHNFRRMTRILMGHPEYSRYKYAIAGSAVCGSSFDYFFPVAQRSQLPQVRWGNFAEIEPGYESPWLYLMRSFKIDPAFLSTNIAIPGINLDAQPFRKNIYNTGGSPGLEFAAAMADLDPEIARYLQVIEIRTAESVVRSAYNPQCYSMALKSQAILK